MPSQCKRVAVVGGGFAGLGTIKIVKEEGIEPVCFEKSDAFGGTWNYHEEDIHGVPSAMSTTMLNHSKEFLLSDFLSPKETPNYFRHTQMLDYLRNLVDKFDLTRHIVFNTEVIHVKKTPDYEETGRWSVTVKNTIDRSIRTEIFDAVFVCVGHFCYPKMPKYLDMDKFSGDIMHTHSLKEVGNFKRKRVVVVGTGCSALDAAVEISSVAKQVYLSMRTPSWIVGRVGPSGLPLDYVLLRRYIMFFQQILPLRVISGLFEHYIANSLFNHRFYGIKPKYPFLAKDPIVNDGFPSKLLSGAVVLRKNIACFSKDGVIFDSENKVTEVDTVIMGTGYTWNFDFLEKGILNIENGRINLYKCMYPTNLKHPTFALIGFLSSIGSGFPLGELQLRLAAHLLAENKPLPSEEIMLKDAKKRHEANVKRYVPSDKISIRVDYIPFADELATELGAMPNFWKMAFADPKLFLACIFGACIPAQYRLVGPHKWEGAREAILTSSERMQMPLSKERLNHKEDTRTRMYVLTNLLIPLMIVYLLSSKNVPLIYYFCALIIPYYLFTSKFFSKYLIVLFLLPYFFNAHGFVALYLLTVAMFIFFNFRNLYIPVDSHFWT